MVRVGVATGSGALKRLQLGELLFLLAKANEGKSITLRAYRGRLSCTLALRDLYLTPAECHLFLISGFRHWRRITLGILVWRVYVDSHRRGKRVGNAAV